MSVDILMYKIQSLNEDEVRNIHRMNVNDLDDIDGQAKTEIDDDLLQYGNIHPTYFERKM